MSIDAARVPSFDVLTVGGKGSGKTLYATAVAFDYFEHGYKIFSNYKLRFPYTHINSLSELSSISNGLFLCDDCERWCSSKFLKNSEKADLLEIILNLGKRGITSIFISKRVKEVDKTITAIVDRIVVPQIFLNKKFYGSVDDFDRLASDPKNWYMDVGVYNNGGFYLGKQLVTDLDLYCQLYDTREEVDFLSD